jgi:hypothetical protein
MRVSFGDSPPRRSVKSDDNNVAASRVSAQGVPGQQLQAALSVAIRAGRSSFWIHAGTYRFDRHDLLANKARDLSIAPEGDAAVTLLFRCNWGLVLRSCTNVSVPG